MIYFSDNFCRNNQFKWYTCKAKNFRLKKKMISLFFFLILSNSENCLICFVYRAQSFSFSCLIVTLRFGIGSEVCFFKVCFFSFFFFCFEFSKEIWIRLKYLGCSLNEHVVAMPMRKPMPMLLLRMHSLACRQNYAVRCTCYLT